MASVTDETDGSAPAEDPGAGREPSGEPERERLGERLVDAAYEAEYATGRREETLEQARSSIHRRVARMFVGFALLFTGVLLLVLPGPGWLCIAAGLGILSRDVAWAERALERVRRRLPQDSQGRVAKPVIATSVLLALAGVAASVWFMLR